MTFELMCHVQSKRNNIKTKQEYVLESSGRAATSIKLETTVLLVCLTIALVESGLPSFDRPTCLHNSACILLVHARIAPMC